MDTFKIIKASTYSIQIPESWKTIDFDENKYELGLINENRGNSIFFNVSKCFKLINPEKREGQFVFGRMRVNILNETINNIDETYCGNIDLLNRNDWDTIMIMLESIKPIFIGE